VNWDWRTVGIDRCTLFEEILGSVGGVQYDDNLPKNVERQDIPYRSRQKRISAKERFVPCIFANRVYASQEKLLGISRRLPMIGKGRGPGG